MLMCGCLLQNYVRPIFVDDDEPVQMQICSGRHPVCSLKFNYLNINILYKIYVLTLQDEY